MNPIIISQQKCGWQSSVKGVTSAVLSVAYNYQNVGLHNGAAILRCDFLSDVGDKVIQYIYHGTS